MGTRGTDLQDGMGLLGYEIGSHYLVDLLQHMADIDHAFGRDKLNDDEALVVALDFFLDTFHEAPTGSASRIGCGASAR